MEFSQDDFDRLLMFEHTRKSAEATYAKDPLDADNLTKWGGALIELSQFQSVPDAKKMLNDAISKLEEALVINPARLTHYGIEMQIPHMHFLLTLLRQKGILIKHLITSNKPMRNPVTISTENLKSLQRHQSYTWRSISMELVNRLWVEGLLLLQMQRVPRRIRRVVISNMTFLDGSLQLGLLHGWEWRNPMFPLHLQDKAIK
uniref:TOM20 n=1 Tax=Hevea brasiliensis TaxID=3981 RepID=Q19D24_HEVBR|nr:TOM20 [Hevea brasiliensis]